MARFAWTFAAALLLWPGCALIDGLQGDDDPIDCLGVPAEDGPDCPPPGEQFTCAQPHIIEFQADGTPLSDFVDLCGQDQTAFNAACTSGEFNPGSDMIVSVENPFPQEYEVCVQGPPELIATIGIGCDDGNGVITPLDCVNNDICSFVFVDQPEFIIHLQTGFDQICGPVDISVRPTNIGPMPETGSACLDGFDNDTDGLQDCEDDECWDTAECETGASVERCNGFDEGSPFMSIPFEAIDELACACVDDEGCDHISIETGIIYVCHPGDPNGMRSAACAPDCFEVDWCPEFGLRCEAGRCVPN
jgi:hypothetical protein